MSKAQQAAERAAALYVDQHYVDDAGPGHWENTFLEGVAWVLPEVPDPAVIEAIKRALFSTEEIDGADAAWHNYWEGAARAAYAALRGAMQ